MCDRWCVTKMCVKVGGDKVVCEKDACEIWYVTKLCVKDGVRQRCCVGDKDAVCDKVVYERWCGQSCVCVAKMVCDKVVCAIDGL